MFQRTQAFLLGQCAPHSMFPTHHRLWDTTRRAFASGVVLREISEKIRSERTIDSNLFFRQETSRTLWVKAELNCSVMTAN
jgi:hypothetical protein